MLHSSPKGLSTRWGELDDDELFGGYLNLLSSSKQVTPKVMWKPKNFHKLRLGANLLGMEKESRSFLVDHGNRKFRVLLEAVHHKFPPAILTGNININDEKGSRQLYL